MSTPKIGTEGQESVAQPLRERLAAAASWDALGIELAVSVDTALSEFGAYLREQAKGYESRAQYEIKMRRERGGMRMRTAAIALAGIAEDIDPGGSPSLGDAIGHRADSISPEATP